MSTDRVDKSWKSKGLGGYSNDAILNTLRHYGVTVDETTFRDLAKDSTPLHIAGAWKPSWKGTGQFQQFPYAAAEELLTRYFPDRLTPFQLAQTVIAAILRASAVMGGQPDVSADVFAEFEAKKATLPAPGEQRNLFNSELIGFLERFQQPFNSLPKDLAKAGHRELAMKFAGLHEGIFPDRVGAVTALVRAVTDDRDAAVKELVALGSDTSRDLFARHAAVDALYQAEAWDALKPLGLKLFDACAEKKQWPVADSIAHMLASAMQKSGASDKVYAEEVMKRFTLAHQHVGGHGHGH